MSLLVVDTSDDGSSFSSVFVSDSEEKLNGSIGVSVSFVGSVASWGIVFIDGLFWFSSIYL